MKYKVFDNDKALAKFLKKKNIVPFSTHTTPFKVSFEVDDGDSWDNLGSGEKVAFQYKVTLLYKKDKRKFI